MRSLIQSYSKTSSLSALFHRYGQVKNQINEGGAEHRLHLFGFYVLSKTFFAMQGFHMDNAKRYISLWRK